MAEWWYVDRDRKVGPIDSNEVSDLIRDGKIVAKTMLWKEGMDSWSHLDEIDELLTVQKSVPPPIPTNSKSAGSFPRFFARMFDTWWETILIGFLLSAILGEYSSAFDVWILSNSYAGLVFGILCLPLALVLDAVVYNIAGNTPGKALLGVQVRHANGERLELDRYVSRNFSMWWYGLAAGVPFINLITMSNQGDRLNKGELASYDEAAGYVVTARPTGLAKKAAFGAAFFCLFMIIAGIGNVSNLKYNTKISNNISEMNQFEHAPKPSNNRYSWVNPITGKGAIIDSKWKISAQKNEVGDTVHTFSNEESRAAVIMAAEYYAGLSLLDYVSGLKENMTAEVKYNDGGKYYAGKHGEFVWDGSGSIADIERSKIDIKVVLVGDKFWRVIAIQFKPDNSSIEAIQNSLWKTVL